VHNFSTMCTCAKPLGSVHMLTLYDWCTQKVLASDHVYKYWSDANVGSSKNLGRATFGKMPEAGLKIAQKGLKNTFFCQNFAEAPSLARVWVGYFGFWGGGLNPPDPPTPMYACSILNQCFLYLTKIF